MKMLCFGYEPGAARLQVLLYYNCRSKDQFYKSFMSLVDYPEAFQPCLMVTLCGHTLVP